MKITIEFEHTRKEWCGRLVKAAGAFLFSQSYWRDKRPAQKFSPQSDPHGAKAARRQFQNKMHPHLLMPYPAGGIHSAKQFERYFIGCAQKFILEEAKHYGTVVVPSNYLEEIWTADFIVKFAKALSRKGNREKFARLRNLESLLIGAWSKMELHKLRPTELHRLVQQSPFGKNISKANLKTICYRLGLTADEGNLGPRPASETKAEPLL